MIEIILLFFLTRKIGRQAAEKGETPWKWKVSAVLTWFAAEFTGYGLFIFGTGIADPTKDMFHVLMMAAFGLGSGYLGYLFTEYMLKKKVESNPEF